MTDEQIEEFRRFVEDVRAYLADPDLTDDAHAVAVLVRETAVAAFVRGAMWDDPRGMPGDSEILRQARETARTFPDLYPAWAYIDRVDEG